MRAKPFQLGSILIWACWGVLLSFTFAASSCAKAAGPLPGFNTTTPYLVYYGSWNASQVDYARMNYRLVVVDAHNISATQIASIKRGPDNTGGTADDVY